MDNPGPGCLLILMFLALIGVIIFLGVIWNVLTS